MFFWELAVGGIVAKRLVRLAVVVLAFGSAVGCGGGAVTVPTSFTHYNAKDGTFACDAPDGWEVKGGGKRGPVWAKFTSGAGVVRINGTLSDSLLGDAMGGRTADSQAIALEDAPVHAIHVANIDKADAEYAGYTEVAGYPQELDCRIGPARVSEFTASGLGGGVHGYRATCLGHDKGLTIYCVVPESQWAKVQPTFDRILASLERGVAE